MKILLTIVFVLLFTGCANTNNLYYWGDYSSTLYSHKKNMTEASSKKHFSELNEIIEKSAKYNKKVPPGIYTELAILLSEKGSTDQSLTYLQREKELYPESTTLINRMIETLKEKE